MATLAGKNAHVYIGSGGVAIPITEAGDFTIDVDYGLDMDNAFGDTWETNVRIFTKFSGQVVANFDTAQTHMFDAAQATAPVNMYLYPDRASTGRYYYGTVWPKASVNVPFGLAKSTFAFTGDGALSVK